MERYVASTKIVKRDGEYIVRCYDQYGERLPAADYFTNDHDDAVMTANYITRPAQQNGR